nr:MAG TPA: hypothetical protein [Microviridae sp.]
MLTGVQFMLFRFELHSFFLSCFDSSKIAIKERERS